MSESSSRRQPRPSASGEKPVRDSGGRRPLPKPRKPLVLFKSWLRRVRGSTDDGGSPPGGAGA